VLGLFPEVLKFLVFFTEQAGVGKEENPGYLDNGAFDLIIT